MPQVDRTEALATELERIRDCVRRNVPRHSKPERFHEDKSQIAGDLSRVIESLRTGRPLRRDA